MCIYIYIWVYRYRIDWYHFRYGLRGAPALMDYGSGKLAMDEWVNTMFWKLESDWIIIGYRASQNDWLLGESAWLAAGRVSVTGCLASQINWLKGDRLLRESEWPVTGRVRVTGYLASQNHCLEGESESRATGKVRTFACSFVGPRSIWQQFLLLLSIRLK